MRAREGERRVHVVGLIAVVALIAAAGCLGFGEEPIGENTASMNEAGLSEATQALHENGYADPYLDVEATGVAHEFEFWIDENVALNPYGDKEAWGFGFTEDPDEPASIPGPEIRVTQGDTVRVTLNTPDSEFPGHTMHWHGYDVPWSSDGVPFVTQDIAETQEEHTITYEFVAKQPGTYWYHCVVSFPVDIDHGLFGALIVEPQAPDDELPYDREETLMFHEMDSQWLAVQGWAINENSEQNPDDLPDNPIDAAESLKHQARATSDVAGFVAGDATGEYLFSEGPRDYYPQWSPRYQPLYDTFMINGKSYPDTEPVEISEGETLKLRMINAGQLHKSIHLHGHHVLVTHVDGYGLPAPHWEDTLSLAPGERKDVLVQGTNPGIWSLHDHSGAYGMGATSTNDYAFPGGMKTVLTYEGFHPPNALPQPDGDITAGNLAVYAPSYSG